MDEKNRGQITGPKENATGELPYVPDKLVRRRSSRNKVWVIFNTTLVKPYHQHILILITSVGD
jgi:hypothetical protein